MDRCKTTVWLATWLALATGFLESTYWIVKRTTPHELRFLHPDVPWMAPLGQLLLFLPLAVVLLGVAFYFPRRDPVKWVVFVLAFLAWLNPLTLVPGLENFARVIASLGLAAATARGFERYSEWCLRKVRRTLPWLTAAVVLLAVVHELGQAAKRERPTAASPAGSAKPNILLIVLDTVRADALGLYGGKPGTSPFLDEFARQSVVFERALSTAPWTLTSTAGMLTGRLPHEISADWNTALDVAYPTVAEYFRDEGYATGGFVANTRYCSRETGLGRGFQTYRDYGYRWGDFVLATSVGRWFVTTDLAPRIGLYNLLGRKAAPTINRNFLDWLSNQEGRPFFAFLNYFDAHHPYVAPAPFDQHQPRTALERQLFCQWWWYAKDRVSKADEHYCRAAYEDCIRYLDSQLKELFQELAGRGVLENTIVVITSDHGEHFGEHDLYLHGNSLYQPLLHVPLLIRFPGRVPADVRVPQTVSLTDLPATLVDLQSENALSANSPFTGRSLAELWDADAPRPTREPAVAVIRRAPGGPLPCHGQSPIAKGPMAMAVIDPLKLIWTPQGVELYDLSTDPSEATDLSREPQYREQLEQLRHYVPSAWLQVGPSTTASSAE